MLLGIGIVLLALWFLGFVIFHVAGFLIQLLLIAAIIIIIARLAGGGKSSASNR